MQNISANARDLNLKFKSFGFVYAEKCDVLRIVTLFFTFDTASNGRKDVIFGA